MKSFSCKTPQFCVIQRECEMAETLTSVTVRKSMKARAKLSFDYKSEFLVNVNATRSMSNKSRPNCLRYRPVAHLTAVQSLYNRLFGTPEIPFHSVIFGLEWNCDFLACSAYQFYGPHIWILWPSRSARHWRRNILRCRSLIKIF
jgi:hypothetical protein